MRGTYGDGPYQLAPRRKSAHRIPNQTATDTGLRLGEAAANAPPAIVNIDLHPQLLLENGFRAPCFADADASLQNCEK
jgi:hypothetical protein